MGMGIAHDSARLPSDHIPTVVRTHLPGLNSPLHPPLLPPSGHTIVCDAHDGAGEPPQVPCDSLTTPEVDFDSCAGKEKNPAVTRYVATCATGVVHERACHAPGFGVPPSPNDPPHDRLLKLPCSARVVRAPPSSADADASRTPTVHGKGDRSKFVDANPKSSKVSKVEGSNRAHIMQQPADGRTAPSRTRARSHSEPTNAKHAKHRSRLAQRATPSARIATIGNDCPMRERASSVTAKEDRTSSAVAPAKRIRIAPSTARTCVTSQPRAFLEGAKRLASEQPTPRYDHHS